MRIFNSKNLNSRIITAKIDTTWCFYSPTNYSPNFYFYSLKSTKTKQLDYLKRKLKEKAIRFCRLILIFLIIWCSPSRISDKSQTLRKRLIFSLSQFRKQLTWKKKVRKTRVLTVEASKCATNNSILFKISVQLNIIGPIIIFNSVKVFDI